MRARLVDVVSAEVPRETQTGSIASLARGGFGERSDIDLVVRGLTPSEVTRLEIALIRAVRRPLEVLRFEDTPEPFGQRVDREGVALRRS